MLRILLLLSFLLSNTLVQAGGFDSSGRPFEIIFGDQNALEISVSHIRPEVKLSVTRDQRDGTAMPAVANNDITNDYSEPRFALRFQVNDVVVCAAQHERPFRFKTQYRDDSLSHLNNDSDPSSQVAAPINSSYMSESLTLACRMRYHLFHTDGWFKESLFSIIGGPKVQRIEGVFSTDLTDQNLGVGDNYQATLRGSTELGYLFGLAYEIPEIALRASLFFHNEIEHDLKGEVQAPSPDFTQLQTADAKGKTLTPKAINFRLQSGILENWLAFVELRWGNWSKLDYMQVEAGDLSGGLVLFKNDTLNYKIGLGTKISERFSLGGYVESFIDLDPPEVPKGIDGTNLRNPQADRISLALGGKYLLKNNLELSLGASYYYIKQGKFSDGNYTVALASSQALAASGTLTYLF